MGLLGQIFTAAYIADQELNRREAEERHRREILEAQTQPVEPEWVEEPTEEELDQPTESAKAYLRRLLDSRLVPPKYGRTGEERIAEVEDLLDSSQLTGTQVARLICLLREYPVRGEPIEPNDWLICIIDIESRYR